MNRSEWLNRLEALHHRVREGEALGEAERGWYDQARGALLSTALEVQALALTHENVRRRSIRVTRAAPVLLEARGWAAHSMTTDLGSGGFAVLLEQPPPVDDWIKATLLLPGEGPVVVSVAVADSRLVNGLVRVALRFCEPSDQVLRRIEGYMLDAVLEQLVFWEDVLEKLEA